MPQKRHSHWQPPRLTGAGAGTALRPAAPLGRPVSQAQTRLAVRSPARASPAVAQVTPRPQPGRHEGRHATCPGAGCRCSGSLAASPQQGPHAAGAQHDAAADSPWGRAEAGRAPAALPTPRSAPRPPERSFPVPTVMGPEVSTQRSPPPESSTTRSCFSCWAPHPGQKRGAGKHRGREPPFPGCTLTHAHTHPPRRPLRHRLEGSSFSALQKGLREEKSPGQGSQPGPLCASGDIWHHLETFLFVITWGPVAQALCSAHASVPTAVPRRARSPASEDGMLPAGAADGRAARQGPAGLLLHEDHGARRCGRSTGEGRTMTADPGQPGAARSTPVLPPPLPPPPDSSPSGCRPPVSAPQPQQASRAPQTHSTPDACPPRTPPTDDQQDHMLRALTTLLAGPRGGCSPNTNWGAPRSSVLFLTPHRAVDKRTPSRASACRAPGPWPSGGFHVRRPSPAQGTEARPVSVEGAGAEGRAGPGVRPGAGLGATPCTCAGAPVPLGPGQRSGDAVCSWPLASLNGSHPRAGRASGSQRPFHR